MVAKVKRLYNIVFLWFFYEYGDVHVMEIILHL